MLHGTQQPVLVYYFTHGAQPWTRLEYGSSSQEVSGILMQLICCVVPTLMNNSAKNHCWLLPWCLQPSILVSEQTRASSACHISLHACLRMAH